MGDTIPHINKNHETPGNKLGKKCVRLKWIQFQNFIIHISEWEDTIVNILVCPNYSRFEAIPIKITIWVFVIVVIRFGLVWWV